MNTKDIKKVLTRYFEANTTADEENDLISYFLSDGVDPELSDYIPYFAGISEIAASTGDEAIENEVMSHILENETGEKSGYRRLWPWITGIAATLLIAVSGYLFYEYRQQTVRDTFSNPEQAYAYAGQTLMYVSSKYNKGLSQLTSFNKIDSAVDPLSKRIQPLNNFLQGIEKIKNSK